MTSLKKKHIMLTVHLDIQPRTEIAVPKQTVGLLGKEYLSVKESITLPCDWNQNTLYITH